MTTKGLVRDCPWQLQGLLQQVKQENGSWNMLDTWNAEGHSREAHTGTSGEEVGVQGKSIPNQDKYLQHDIKNYFKLKDKNIVRKKDKSDVQEMLIRGNSNDDIINLSDQRNL